jgi:molybdenum cofactor synthesis domain-containing protein
MTGVQRRPTKPRPPKRSPRSPAPRVAPGRTGPRWVELISIGRELLRGRVADENGPALALELTRRGWTVRRLTVVDDRDGAIASALREALGRNPHLVITTGGLGPAPDDRTLDAVAEALGKPLVIHAEARSMVERGYEELARRRLTSRGGLTAARQKLCEIPIGAVPLPNPLGPAPGVLSHVAGGTSVLCLPGTPSEARAVLGIALDRIPGPRGRSHIIEREVESPTADESELRTLLERLAAEYPQVWINSHPARPGEAGTPILIRFEAAGRDAREATTAAEKAVARLLALAAGSP